MESQIRIRNWYPQFGNNEIMYPMKDTVPFYSSFLQRGLLKKVGKNESCAVQNNTTMLVMLFVLLGSMMVVIPMLIEQVNARTDSKASGGVGEHGPPFTNVKWELKKGKFEKQPKLTDNGRSIEWVTVGSGVFGGTEFGHVTADYGSHKVTFTWFNPEVGLFGNEPLGCNVKWTGNAVGWCTIRSNAGVTSGPFAFARFNFDTNCNIFKCQENGSNSQNVEFDDIFKHGHSIIHFPIDIHHPSLSDLDELHR